MIHFSKSRKKREPYRIVYKRRCLQCLLHLVRGGLWRRHSAGENLRGSLGNKFLGLRRCLHQRVDSFLFLNVELVLGLK